MPDSWCQHHSTHPPHHGFSLVELLVSLGIISLLMAFILPGLMQSREVARRAECSSHQQQIGLAVQLFANDHQSVFPREGIGPWSPLPPHISMRNQYIPWVNAIAPYILNRDGDIVSPILSDPSHPNPNHFCHYVMNGISFEVLKFGGLILRTANRRGAGFIHQWPRAHEMVYLTAFADDKDNSIAEEVGSWIPYQIAPVYDVWNRDHLWGPEINSDRNATNVRRVAYGRHGDNNNVLYLDGHVAQVNGESLSKVSQWYDGRPRLDD